MNKPYHFVIIIFLLLTFEFNISPGFAIPDLKNKNSEFLKPGIIQHNIKLDSVRGPIQAYVLEIDLLNDNISFLNAYPNPEFLRTKKKLSDLTLQYMAFAGVNTSYFDVKEGNSLGLNKSKNKWITGSVYNRAAIGFSEDNRVLFNRVKLIGKVSKTQSNLRSSISDVYISCYNTPRKVGMGICLYDGKWGIQFIPEVGDSIASVKDSCVIDHSNSKANIRENDYILVGPHKDLENIFMIGDCLNIDWQTEPSFNNFKEVISGGPFLLKDGELYIDDVEERLVFHGMNFYAPRTAIGVDEKNKLYIVVVDGRQENLSVGMSLKELAIFLKHLGLKSAINLDGGGSSTLVVNGKILNNPSDNEERAISNGLLIYYKD